eukprot:sb/3478176/
MAPSTRETGLMTCEMVTESTVMSIAIHMRENGTTILDMVRVCTHMPKPDLSILEPGRMERGRVVVNGFTRTISTWVDLPTTNLTERASMCFLISPASRRAST